MSGGGFRVSPIPNSVRKTIQNIKEITGNHSEDEIYAMLKECSMDPNETAQRLLLQGPFREVKRKRDRKKESLNNKESAESRWRSGSQGRGSRGVRGNFSPRYAQHEAGGSKSSGPGRDNGMNQIAEKGSVQSSSTSQDTKTKEPTLVASPVPVMANGPTGVVVETSSAPSRNAAIQPQENSSVDNKEFGSAPSPVDAINKPTIAFGSGDMSGQPAASSSDCFLSTAPASSSAICFSTSDPVLVPSSDSRLIGTLGTIKRKVGSNRASTEPNAVIPTENKLASAATEISSSFMQGKMPGKSSGVVKNPRSEFAQPSSTATHGSSMSRPSSNYSGRSQQIIGPQKVGSNKEWKPKPISSNVGQVSGTSGASEVPTSLEANAQSTTSLEAISQSQPVSSDLDSEEATSKLRKKLEDLHLPQRQHVIIPDHIHVPESERTKLSFGSFDASFGVTLSYVGGQESGKSSTPLSETSQDVDEIAEEQASSNQNALATAEEGDYTDHPQSPAHAPENLSGDGDVPSSIPEYNENKQENALPSVGHQFSVVHTSPNYSFGIMPPILAPFENAESQAREVSRLSSLPFDPASYYAQFYRTSADDDGRISPFPSVGVATKYNGSVAVLPPQTSQSPQEGGNSLVLTTASPTPLVTQAAGLMQSSIAVTQQPVPVYRSAAGVHLPHYPPSYIQYAPFYSPFYVPSPAIHQFINNGAFPQQPQAGTVYPSAPAAPNSGVKFSLPQFKPGTNTANSTHIGMPSGYGPYGSSPAGYNPSSSATTGNSTTNEDLGASQFKESNVYITGQQSEGSAVWIAPPGRDISNLPASSFYNLPPQGQNVTFSPTQVAPGSFAGIYHPQAVTAAAVHPLLQQAQTMAGAVDMGGPAASVYQQPQHAQMNWPSFNGGERQEDTSLARVENVNLFGEARKKLPVVSSICLG
ncbi:GBF-interacting protein 1-like isoform X3 [Durio zibethinus]|uniref:GBF-interacting protein 1-like isoform X3 n=1 Tax=Durio zibethinus TaxID=66656 RepID=A0A6P6A2D0_DURZI|nr:GBF-interacting protein 1-like isoform X3 [Durio zibethinus]